MSLPKYIKNNISCHNRFPLSISQHVINLFYATKLVSFVVSWDDIRKGEIKLKVASSMLER